MYWIIPNPDLCLVQMVESTPFSKQTWRRFVIRDLIPRRHGHQKQNTTIFVGFTSLASFFPMEWYYYKYVCVYICVYSMYNAQSWNHKEPEINGGFPKQPFVVQALCHSETANVFLVVGANRPRSTLQKPPCGSPWAPWAIPAICGHFKWGQSWFKPSNAMKFGGTLFSENHTCLMNFTKNLGWLTNQPWKPTVERIQPEKLPIEPKKFVDFQKYNAKIWNETTITSHKKTKSC